MGGGGGEKHPSPLASWKKPPRDYYRNYYCSGHGPSGGSGYKPGSLSYPFAQGQNQPGDLEPVTLPQPQGGGKGNQFRKTWPRNPQGRARAVSEVGK